MIDDDAAYTKAELDRIGEEWMEKIRQAEQREDTWMKNAERAEKAYAAEAMTGEHAGQAIEFNILHSNVETIVPAIFNSTPVPEIRQRHGRQDQSAKLAADVFERAIAQMIDDSRLDQEVEGQAQDAFMAGRGIIRVKFDADEIEQPPIAYVDPMTGDQWEEPQPPVVTNERILFEVVSWRDYREGPAKRWAGVPWVAYRHEITEQERERLENPEYTFPDADKDESKDCTVWEIWCKETRRVYFVVESTHAVLDIKEDPLELPGFFPQVEPVQPITLTGKRTPVCPYTIYLKLAQELDITTQRINKITKGLKVRGGAAFGAEAIQQVMDAGDNEIAVLSDIEGLGAMGGLDKAIMWWPVEQAVVVLQQLYVQREQTKQAIYELTGISDIIRGQGKASETATAQQIKTEWGALRIQKMQRMLQRQVRDIFVLCAEIIAMHFSPQTLQKMSGIQITPEVAAMLNKPLDHYRIDVETDSTVRANQTRNRQEMSEFLRGTAEFFSTMAPIVSQAPQAAGPLAKMYSAFASQFNLGKSAEDALEQFVQMAEAAAEQPRENPEAKAREEEMRLKLDELKAKMQLEVEKLRLEAEKAGLEVELKRAELALKGEEADIKRDALDLDEAKAELQAVQNAVELELEATQERPVAVGKS